MAGNPLVAQGVINRLRASVVWNAIPDLNVTPSYLGEEGISLRLEGDATTRMNTMTGTVTSPEPYMPATVTIALIRSQFLADLYKQQMETNTLLGDCTIRPDASTLSPYQIYNCSLSSVNELQFNGRNAGWVVTATGFYLLNSVLWG